MELKKSEIKIIKYVNNHSGRTYTEIFKKFPEFKECYHRLETNHFIKSEDPNDNLMGNEYKDLENPTIIRIDRNGEIFLQSQKWFTSEYVTSHILVPILLAIISTLITLFLTNMLYQRQETIQQYQPVQEWQFPE